MAWFEAHQELPRHPKARKAAKRLDIPPVHLVGHLWCLWGWALEMADDGNLSKFDPEDIAIGAEWEGDPDVFVQALADCGSAGGAGFLERGGPYGPPEHETVGELVLHGWWERAGKLVAKRRKDARRKRAERADTPPDVQGTSTGHPPDASADGAATSSDGAAHTTQHDTTQENQPLGGADALALDLGPPTKAANGLTYSRTLADWAVAHSERPPDTEARSEVARWLLSVVKRHCPASTKAERSARMNLGRKVVCDYVEDVTVEPASSAFVPRLGRMMNSSGVESIFDSIVVAVESGAGLKPPHDENPDALLDYALAVKNGKGKR